MRKPIMLTLSVLALAIPSVDAYAASQQTLANTVVKKKVSVATKSFRTTGSGFFMPE